MNDPTFRPSDVVLNPHAPLCNTMHRIEREQAAAMLVHACVELGDAWQLLTLRDVERVFTVAMLEGRSPFASWLHNPFFRPDFRELCDKGYARWDRLVVGGELAIAFTDYGLEAMRRWVRRATPATPPAADGDEQPTPSQLLSGLGTTPDGAR